MADHRQVINHVLGEDLGMRLLQQNGKMNQYVGLWSVWWSNSGEIASMKVVIGTVLRNFNPLVSESTQLKDLPWVVLQLQTLSPDDDKWPLVYKTLYMEIDAKGRDVPTAQRCTGKIAYDTIQSNTARRQLVDADLLQDYTIIRADDSRSDPKPMEVSNRKRIQYLVYRGRESDLRLQPVQVFIEKLVSKRAPLSQRLHSETGLSKTTSLLSAVNDWRTWIVLGS